MKGRELDLCLSLGYYRMQQQVFTCRYLVVNNVSCPVYWLRIALPNATLGPKQARLFRINAAYSVAVKPLVLSDELETLYALYRNSVDFDTYETVESCLLNGSTHSLFDTYVIEIRDGNTLIAAGIFDRGDRSIAGIINFYDPAYRRQSIGKYLMLLKMNVAQGQQLAYYYPGYIVMNYPKFDYKLFACEAATEVYDERYNQWLPFSWETAAVLTTENVGA